MKIQNLLLRNYTFLKIIIKDNIYRTLFYIKIDLIITEYNNKKINIYLSILKVKIFIINYNLKYKIMNEKIIIFYRI